MTYTDILDWLEDEYGYNWEEWTDLKELYDAVSNDWHRFERNNFPLNLDNFVNEFEDDRHFETIGQDVTPSRLEDLINNLFGG